ncbi:tRNA (adenosine(37)-N6)-dimethylallyltransferase MiaA [Candidatus Shapirobacteria bacterium]|nr:tRNA (adenosine(37)-N6)-dimethylallyltransferase MiaA [Candidatus Shapirobacteria bacterium]
MSKVLIISGPTATGKTDMAVKVALALGGELISADSRQVYQGLDIGVGKDHPTGTPIHLIDLVKPSSRFSVSSYQELALEKINHLHRQGKLPIVVGCSGLYIDSIVSQKYSNFGVRPNHGLRLFLEALPTPVLKFLLRTFDKSTYQKLNNSDVNNPRRLVRKLELKLLNTKPAATHSNHDFNILHVSLTAPNEYLFPRIDARVHARMELGHLEELKTLKSKYKWSDPGLEVSCYRVFKDFFNRKTTQKKAIELWKFAEHKDARHQKTWFKKYQSAISVDISNKKQLDTTINKITKWYNKTNS